MNMVAIIPARMGSSRFPGKPLAPILGRPMIEHVYQRSKMCASLDDVYIATCDKEIRKAAEAFGAPVIMTSSAHQRASERVAEAVQKLPQRPDITVMVQGDEPMVTPEMIDRALAPMLHDPDVVCVNLVTRIRDEREFRDPNTVKVVMDQNGHALYFSREPVPSAWKTGFEGLTAFKQVCVIPFRTEFLLGYIEMDPTPLEIAESVDMLRILEHGFPVHCVVTETWTHAVDTPDDRELVERWMRSDPLVRRYQS